MLFFLPLGFNFCSNEVVGINFFYNDYFFVGLFLYIFFVFIISCILFLVSFTFVFQRRYSEKTTPYECGFQPYGDSCINFEVRYYLLTVLFLIFDVEVVFLLPFCAGMLVVGFFEYMVMFIFNILLLSTLLIELYYNVFTFEFTI
jgi:NADH-quinone oxidoreductase subunit A